MTTDPPPQRLWLIPGFNFPTWPDLKWARGSAHAAAFRAAFDEWLASQPARVDWDLNESRDRIDLIARVREAPPSMSLSLTLGDALHNFRSALDAAAWGLATYDGAVPTNPKDVYFPICLEASQWRTAERKWVSDIHPELRRRLKLLQPYTYQHSRPIHAFTFLHDLDIQDKHRHSVNVVMEVPSVSVSSFFKYEDPTFEPTADVKLWPDVAFEDGANIGEVVLGSRIEPHFQVQTRPNMTLQVDRGDTNIDAFAVLDLLAQQTRLVLDILMRGLDTDRSTAAA